MTIAKCQFLKVMNPINILWQSVKLWWQHWIGILVLNVVWFLLQVLLVTGPPATAVAFTISQRIHNGEAWDWQDLVQLFRELFWPAWQWALPNLLLVMVIVGNFYAYREFTGLMWTALRLFWGVIAVVWFMLNLFYWPFWLAQADKSLKTTYQNTFRFFVLHSWTVLAVTGVAAIVMVLSVLYILPLTIGGVVLVMIVAVTAVAQSMANMKREV